MAERYLLVFLGGGLGSLARYWLSGVVQRWSGSGFPFGTLTVNVAGCLVIGVLMTAFEDRFLVNPAARVFLTIGILGGFTTFSSFSYETIALIRDSEFLFAAANIGGTVVTCLAATWCGVLLGKFL